jgi:hypothetical protein
LGGQQWHHRLAVDNAEQRYLRSVEERLEQNRMARVQQAGRMGPSGFAVGRHDHTLARSETVVLDHPCRFTALRPESVQRRVEAGGVVDDLALGGPNACRRHHVFGERLRPFDAGGLLGRAEAHNTCGSDRIGHTDDQRHLGTDDHQIGADLLRKRRHVVAGGDVDVVLVCDGRGAGIARRDGEAVHFGISAQRKQQRVFTGAGSDYQNSHKCQH